MSNIVSNKTETDCNSDKKYFISIILPCYNVDKYIEKALISVINQTLKNIEIICINDGSKDNSLNVLDNLSIKYKDWYKLFIFFVKIYLEKENLLSFHCLYYRVYRY